MRPASPPGMNVGTLRRQMLDSRFDDLRDEDCFGANVTVPHKVAVAALVDSLSETARRIGAVNTVINQRRTPDWRQYRCLRISYAHCCPCGRVSSGIIC